MSSEETTPLALERAAQRAEAGQGHLIAALLPYWRRAFPERDPAEALLATPATLTLVALCRRPRADRWLDDTLSIARATGSDPELLVRFLRAAEAVEKLSSGGPPDAQAIRLLAARDREEDPT